MKSSFVLATIAALSLSVAQNASACACCASRGTYRQYKGELSEYQVDRINGLKIKGTLQKTYNEDDTDMVTSFTGVIQGDKIVLFLTRDANPANAITIKLAPKKSFLDTDLLGQSGPDVTLYKQIEMTGKATSSYAEVTDAMGDTTVVLKGDGNACEWNMQEIIVQIGSKRSKASISGYGTLAQ